MIICMIKSRTQQTRFTSTCQFNIWFLSSCVCISFVLKFPS